MPCLAAADYGCSRSQLFPQLRVGMSAVEAGRYAFKQLRSAHPPAQVPEHLVARVSDHLRAWVPEL